MTRFKQILAFIIFLICVAIGGVIKMKAKEINNQITIQK
jgi:hypothetical protein